MIGGVGWQYMNSLINLRIMKRELQALSISWCEVNDVHMIIHEKNGTYIL